MNNSYNWELHKEVEEYYKSLINDFISKSPTLQSFQDKLLSVCGIRLYDCIDTVCFSSNYNNDDLVSNLELNPVNKNRYENTKGIFPRIILNYESNSIFMMVDSVSDFIQVNKIYVDKDNSHSDPQSAVNWARISNENGVSFFVVSKNGFKWIDDDSKISKEGLDKWKKRFSVRERLSSLENFKKLNLLIEEAKQELPLCAVTNIFFHTERIFWEKRNKAARIMKSKLDSLGVGWCNQDHHTYRSSRRFFKDLINFFESLGFILREKFYAGAEAGWGAQVLENTEAGIVIFADVDLGPEEVSKDFGNENLVEKPRLGTIGLWCALNGESIFESGMHHLEGEFDFIKAQEILRKSGINCMKPFTYFDHLKQVFTEPEVWQVDREKVKLLVSNGIITEQSAQKFISDGSVGSHLEVLERNSGFKGFNQTGVSEIIKRTDPRES